MQVMHLIEKIEELDDVQNVYSALEMSDAVLAALEAA
jgi:transcriptional/translational regulatory protein YebC/TACO1